MATSLASDQPSTAHDLDQSPEHAGDPFLSASGLHNHQRFSNFDTQLFSLGPTTSPDQAKRALEAHLAETERRIQDASKLGTTLVQQRKELSDRLKEVEKQQGEGDISPELRQKLVEIEKEYNEVGRDSARALLPKSRVSSAEHGSGSPHPGEKVSTLRSVSPSKFESQATNSPSKLSVPNRRQRNQPSNRVHDIEFATEISTSLLSQVRHLQALLAEKEETLKEVQIQNSRLEIDAEGFQQRLRALDDSESRYKDENWNLETQIHEHIASAKAAADRENKLTQALNVLQAEKSSAQKELDEIKQTHAKLVEEHTSAVKHHDVELGGVKRTMVMAENEKGALKRKIEELSSQNQELVKAVAHQRARLEEQNSPKGTSEDDFETATDNITPEQSPPPSPIKSTPRHSMLESETLKSSLGHAHRMIQNLKTTIHREKTEKLELKRMLQDARDEIEIRRSEAQNGGQSRPTTRGSRKGPDPKEFKKPARPNQLGGFRVSRNEVQIEDDDWEDHGPDSPSQLPTLSRAAGRAAAASLASGSFGRTNESTDQFETANEASDDFESANERATETEDFQTGVEEMSGSDELTETEGPSGTIRAKHASQLAQRHAGDRTSFQSTASNSGDDYSYEDGRTPQQLQPQKLRLKIGRNNQGHQKMGSEDFVGRPRMGSEDFTGRPRMGSEDFSAAESPASYTSRNGMPRGGQSLFAELGDLNGGSDDETSVEGTPIREVAERNALFNSRPSTATRNPSFAYASVPPLPKPVMVDSGMMTDAWEPTAATSKSPVSLIAGAGLAGAAVAEGIHHVAGSDSTNASDNTQSKDLVDPAANNASSESSVQKPQVPAYTLSNIHTEQVEPVPDVVDERPMTPRKDPQILSMSGVVAEQVTPVAPKEPTLAPLSVSSILAEEVRPITPKAAIPAPLSFSGVLAEHVEPITPRQAEPAPLSFSGVLAEHVEPITPRQAEPAPLSISTVVAEHVEPITPIQPEPAPLSISAVRAEELTPVSPKEAAPILAEPVPLSISAVRAEELTPVSLKEVAPIQAEPVPLSISAVRAEELTPVSPKEAAPAPLSMSSLLAEEVTPINPITPKAAPATLSMSGVVAEEVIPVVPKSPTTAPLSMSAIYHEQVEPIVEPEKTIEQIAIASAVPLTLSYIHSVETAPVEPPAPAYVSRFQEDLGVLTNGSSDSLPSKIKSEEPDTPKSGKMGSVFGWAGKSKNSSTPTIAEDETRQSQSQSPSAETPDSQRPFREISHNASPVKEKKIMADGGSQTALTSEEIDNLINKKQSRGAAAIDSGLPLSSKALSSHKSQESVGSASRTRSKVADSDFENDSVSLKRPSSSHSQRGSVLSAHPPLPADHRQAITAARSGSSSTGPMGPPPVPVRPASSMGSILNRPRTPGSQSQYHTGSLRGVPQRGIYSSGSGVAESQTAPDYRSRQTSISSFASEVDQRFNRIGGMPMPQGIGSNTDPRMIQAITQTMIGEYLWKYTRKTGRGEMSENRHRRYFWVHPYTKTLYWSNKDPQTAGRNELRAKSVAIEAVRVVTDDNPMPPGLHRKSLIVLTPGRSVKFTATTGQRHETWFNALSYLLLRTTEDGGLGDTEEVASGAIHDDDAGDFNPSSSMRSRHGPPSLSSYNSRTTRNDSPARKSVVNMNQPRLTPSPREQRSTSGTFSRLSSYLRPGYESTRSRSRMGGSASGSIYEASEVHDSAEDLREMIEQQDRESDRLENVRACCDGKHDVGSLHHHTGKRGRHSHGPTSAPSAAAASMRSRSHQSMRDDSPAA